MAEMSLGERVANERRRLRSVRQALSAALERGSRGEAAYVPFYLAVADYMEASMHRLHVQDVRMGDLIRERIGGPLNESQRKALGELAERLDGNQAHLQKFLDARDGLASRGSAAIPAFEEAGRNYTGYIVASMGHHGGTTDLARALLTTADWAFMAGITDEETRREQQLFDRVFAVVPPDLALPASA
jgi:hypothetical protein